MQRISVGIDLGATNLRVCYGNGNGIKEKIIQKIPVGEDPKILINKIIDVINSFNVKNFSSIGIGSVGPLDIRTGEVLNTPNLPYKNFNVVEPLEEEFSVPVYIVNDCDAGVMAEKFFGQGKRERNLAYVTISSGIGCGVILDDKLLLGKDGNATEMGHVVVSSEGNMKCGCGKLGHWESYCSGKNMPKYVNFLLGNANSNLKFKKSLLFSLTDGLLENLTSEILFEVGKRKDKLALEVLERIGFLNAVGISAINSAYDVSMVVVGGSVTINNQGLVLDPIRKFLPSLSYNKIPKVEMTKFGDDIVLLGALSLAFNYGKI